MDDEMLLTTPTTELDLALGCTDTCGSTVSLLEAPGETDEVWEIEARLIAGQSDEIIANKLGLSTAIVTEHIAMHFDYRADLDHDSRLFFSAVMGRLTPGGELTEGDIWRLVAWLYGPVGVDLIIDDYHGRTDPKNTEATVLAGLLRAQAVVRFVSPRCKPYADALRQLRKRFSRRRDASAKKIVAYCNLLLIAAGWNPNGKGRLDSKARCAASDKLTDEQLSDQIQKAWDEIKEVK